MFGWEFPPVISGGLGVASHGIVQALLNQQINILLVLPYLHQNISKEEKSIDYIEALNYGETTGKIQIELIDTLLQPYLIQKNGIKQTYGYNLWSEVRQYADHAMRIIHDHSYDIIHAHEWLTILAGIEAKKNSNKTLIFHVHALEHDRNPLYPNMEIQAIEKLGLETADLIIAVSDYTKNNIIEHYHIPAEKIVVVHNGYSENIKPLSNILPTIKRQFTVLFLGRVTEQKGAYYFVKAAEKILLLRKDIDFIIAGDGDQLPYIIEEAARLGISSHVHFTGFLDRVDVKKIYQLSDIYVMPSTSEPFGIVCLEAIAQGVPVIISKQSGVSEVLTHSLKIDYWDTDQLAEKIMALLDYPALKQEMLLNAQQELLHLTWEAAAQKITNHYQELCVI